MSALASYTLAKSALARLNFANLLLASLYFAHSALTILSLIVFRFGSDSTLTVFDFAKLAIASFAYAKFDCFSLGNPGGRGARGIGGARAKEPEVATYWSQHIQAQ